MLNRIALILLLTQGFLSPVYAGAVPYSGVWAGTIGAERVRVCFSTSNVSQYYYIKHLRDIRLMSKTDSTNPVSEWQEVVSGGATKKVSGIWKFNEKVLNDSLSGAWYSPQGNRKLAISLSKVADLKNQSCGAEYNVPMEGLTSEEVRKWNVFFLPLTYKGAPQFNAYVRSWVLEKAGEAYACQSGFGNEANFEFNTLPDWTDKVFVVREMQFDVYCGGAHNSAYTEYRTFDPQTGDKVDGWTWIRAEKESTRGDSPLQTLIEELYRGAASEDCPDGFDVRPPYPTKKGFEFPTNFGWASRVCDSTVLIPYEKLTPYLTAEGKAVATIFKRR